MRYSNVKKTNTAKYIDSCFTTCLPIRLANVRFSYKYDILGFLHEKREKYESRPQLCEIFTM